MILKNPTWQSISPGLPDYEPLDGDMALSIQHALKLHGDVYQAVFAGVARNFYKLIAKKSGYKYFIKHVNDKERAHYIAAENLAKALQSNNVCINAAVTIKKNFFVYPLIEGNRVHPSLEDITSLGKSLAALHENLRKYPKQEALIKNTTHRISLLQEIRERIATSELKVGPVHDYVKRLANNPVLNFTAGNSIQALHGDLNPGNILLQGDNIYFFDFEDTVHSVLPTVYELGYIIERMILTRLSSPEEAIKLGKSFMQAYLANNGNYSYCENDCNVLLSLALRSFTVLTLCEISGNRINAAEWYKFKNLAELAVNTKHILKNILQN